MRRLTARSLRHKFSLRRIKVKGLCTRVWLFRDSDAFMQSRQGQWMQRVKDDGKRSQIDETFYVRVSPVKCKTILTRLPTESGGETVFQLPLINTFVYIYDNGYLEPDVCRRIRFRQDVCRLFSKTYAFNPCICPLYLWYLSFFYDGIQYFKLFKILYPLIETKCPPFVVCSLKDFIFYFCIRDSKNFMRFQILNVIISTAMLRIFANMIRKGSKF